jgi:hypothetical protein
VIVALAWMYLSWKLLTEDRGTGKSKITRKTQL